MGVNIKSLGQRLSQYRELSDFTMERLAAQSGVAENTILALEKGRGNPTLKTLDALSRALNVTVLDLITETTAPPPKNTRARAVAAAANPQDMVAGLEFLTAFVRQEKDIQLVAMALVFEDLSYLKQVSPEYRAQLSLLSQQLLKALA